MADQHKILSLKLNAAKARGNIIRMLKANRHGHLGGAFSAMEIVTALYFYKMNVDPKNPQMEERDRFILSAGHKCLVQYAVLAQKGFFPMEVLDTYGSLHTKLPGHPDMHKLPGVEANTGALGHGLSIACGMAIGLKQENRKSRVYVVTGDGELPEGSNWEAASIAAHYHLDNIVVFVDYNGLQISGKVEDIMNMSPIADRFASFGWSVRSINGNSMEEVVDTLDAVPFETGKPSVVIAHTVKAKGLSFGEGNPSYHYWNPTAEELAKAEAEINQAIDELNAQMVKGVRS